MQPKSTYVSSILDEIGVSKFTWKLFVIAGATMVFDGYDYMIVAYTLKQISAEWGLSAVATGSLASWSLMGLIIGGIISGMVSDKIGRKKTLIASVLVYSLFTIPIFFVHNYGAFAVLRVLTGIGLGGCIPVAATLISEFAPTKKRALFITMGMGCNIFGYVLAGLVATAVVPTIGWRYCYLIGGIPLLYTILIYFKLPESVQWQVNNNRKADALATLQKIELLVYGKATERSVDDLAVPPKPPTVGPKALLSKKYRLSTIGLWLVAFGAGALIYGINAWEPVLLMERGMTLTGSYLLSALQNGVAIGAAVLAGFTAEKFGRRRNLIITFGTTIVAIVLLALVHNNTLLFLTVIFLGFAMNWASTSINPVMLETYPTQFRNTGMAFSQGFARLSGFTMPIIAGAILGAGATFSQLILCFAVPGVVAVLAATFLIRAETSGKSLDELAEEKEKTA